MLGNSAVVGFHRVGRKAEGQGWRKSEWQGGRIESGKAGGLSETGGLPRVRRKANGQGVESSRAAQGCTGLKSHACQGYGRGLNPRAWGETIERRDNEMSRARQ